jgi:dipeptidyl aminopeptidase/acylaminoacyl peptidase
MLLGEEPNPELLAHLSNDTRVTPETPPTFLVHTDEDKAVPAENSVQYYLALRNAGVQAEMHIFQNGRHGLGLAPDEPAMSKWPELLRNWLIVRGIAVR